ncbi:uncharacterized protein K452DRAFT_15935 [Aplosporella prunicola CBS 121167]|uniref:Uncharacterized protein n=1 Tax=Aplosporella prunicola CBS 121167 TaxID=1176127 RepID=A0A6A6AX17_9PEZI|nr:uncharacterized protein K452DRAFT_15935 [Aplosporella prunicola CBS 121167]KAF2135525.1 hypothetical protein K452DRAFT_15935 [Aplosporella prunicola CBS 121167]
MPATGGRRRQSSSLLRSRYRLVRRYDIALQYTKPLDNPPIQHSSRSLICRRYDTSAGAWSRPTRCVQQPDERGMDNDGPALSGRAGWRAEAGNRGRMTRCGDGPRAWKYCAGSVWICIEVGLRTEFPPADVPSRQMHLAPNLQYDLAASPTSADGRLLQGRTRTPWIRPIIKSWRVGTLLCQVNFIPRFLHKREAWASVCRPVLPRSTRLVARR